MSRFTPCAAPKFACHARQPSRRDVRCSFRWATKPEACTGTDTSVYRYPRRRQGWMFLSCAVLVATHVRGDGSSQKSVRWGGGNGDHLLDLDLHFLLRPHRERCLFVAVTLKHHLPARAGSNQIVSPERTMSQTPKLAGCGQRAANCGLKHGREERCATPSWRRPCQS